MKRFVLKGLLVTGLVALLTGCGEEVEVKTIEYYSTHIDEAKKVEEQCKKLEKFNEKEQINCLNASSGVKKSIMDLADTQRTRN